MTAPEPGGDRESSSRPPLAPGASPRAIAASLLDGDRAEFLAEYDRLVERARVDLDLTEVLDMLEHWRGVAVLQADPQRFARNVRRAAERIAGGPVPDDEPLEVTRGKAGALVAYALDSSAVADQVAQWPGDARARFDEVLIVLELTPWNSRPVSRSNPSGLPVVCESRQTAPQHSREVLPSRSFRPCRHTPSTNVSGQYI